LRVHRKCQYSPILSQNAPKCSSLSLCTVEHFLFHHFRPVRSRPSRSTHRHAIFQHPHLPRCPYYITPFSRCQDLFAFFCNFLRTSFLILFFFFFSFLFFYWLLLLLLGELPNFKTSYIYLKMGRMNERDNLSACGGARAPRGM